MPILRPHEYKHARPTLRDAWDRLPVLATISGLGGPLARAPRRPAPAALASLAPACLYSPHK